MPVEDVPGVHDIVQSAVESIEIKIDLQNIEIADIKDKCNDIKKKVDKIKAAVDAL